MSDQHPASKTQLDIRRAARERRPKVVELRKQGLTLKQISAQCGVCERVILRDLQYMGVIEAQRKKQAAYGASNADLVYAMSVPDQIQAAMEELGGIRFLIRWGRKNPGEFITRVWLRLLPKRIALKMTEKVEVDVFARIEQLTAEYRALRPGLRRGGEVKSPDPGHRIGESVDSPAPPPPLGEASAVPDSPAV